MLRTLLVAALALGASAQDLRIHSAGDGEFRFHTGVISAKLRAGGKARGLSEVTHIPSGRTLTQGRLDFGLLSCYRVFSGGQRHGTAAWDWPGEANLREDGSLQAVWPSAPGRPFELSNIYRLSGPSTVDFEAVVQAHADLADFEVFLASYFSPRLTPAVVETKEGFRAAVDAEGRWQMFPRDRAAVQIIQSGRWLLPPNPIEWAIRPEMKRALAFRRDVESGLAVVLMAPSDDCFAIAASQQSDFHYSTYFSLFGRSIRNGERAVARVRMWIVDKASNGEILELASRP